MTTRYVATGIGNDAWDGLSPVWTAGVNGPKATLNGAEDSPVVAGDLIHVRAGAYRETLTCDVSGAAGNAIEYRGDYAGLIWPGAGGVVRITGSDDDQTATRANCIAGAQYDYRTFTGFTMDTCTKALINTTSAAAGLATNWVVQKCLFYPANGIAGISIVNNTAAPSIDNAWTIQDCAFAGGSIHISVGNTNATTSGIVIQNCLFFGTAVNAGVGHSVRFGRVGGITIRNCNFYLVYFGIGQYAALPVGFTPVTVNNCIFWQGATGVSASVLGDIVEDYNCFHGLTVARTNVAVGVNSLDYPPLFDSRWFFQLVTAAATSQVVTPFDLGAWSQLINVAGWLPTATDMRGQGAIGGVREWGSLEYDSSLKIAGGSGGAVSISPYRGGIG